MEEALAKIRPHTSSSLAHQKTPATLLVALEATFQEQSTDSTPTAYFATLLTTLDGTIQKISSGSDESELLYAELYLLALIIPFVSAPVIRTNLSTTSQLTAPLFRTLHPQAPALRSQLTIYDHVFRALDRSQLDAPNLRQCFASVLELCVDPRPKVRKKAAELVKDVLASPPAPLSRHPYAERVSTWVNKVLTEVGTGPRVGQSKGGKQSDTGSETAIHVIAFLRPVLVHLPATALPSVTSLLLTLPRLGNPYLSQSVYNLLSDLLTHLEDDDNFTCGGVAEVLNVILSSSPTKSDTILSPAWVQLVGHAFSIYKTDDQQSYSSELMKVWKTVWDFLDSENAPTRQAAAESLGMLCGCFNKEIINDALQQQQTNHGLNKIVTQISKAFDSLAYARAMPELLSLISSALRGLKYRPTPASGAAAEVLLLPLVTKIGETRVQKGFEFKESADATLGVAMEVLGPEVLLKALPLNLEPADRKAGKEPRAFLLPLLPHPHPSPLSHFVSYFVPMSERMFDLQSTAEAEGRQSEAKVWSVLISQIWSGLVGYCHVTPDLPQGLTASFAQLLSQLLYSQPELRPAVLRALKVMVESNVAVTNPPLEDTPVWDPVYITVAVKNLEFLRSQVESWLAVFFNVFDATDKDARGQVGDVISVWASIAGEEAISKAYAKVLGLFKGAVNGMAKEGQAGAQAHVVATTQDILLVLLPYLSASDSSALFQICLSSEILLAKDNAIQKRGYKILTKLAKAGKFALEAEAVFRQLDELSDGMAAAAKKDRFNLIALLVPFLSSSQLYIIPSLIPEAVLGTKEPSDKARTAAFELILAIASRMNQGGIIKSSLIDGMDEDNASDRTASLEEFVTMLAGGLAASPHMISATVTAISRIVFEYKDTISTKMHNEIFTTLLVFVTSNNREIVKSVLGYVKLAIHTLPIEVVKPHLHELVPALLTWSHDHKNHFKAKVRHVFERMIRRFGWEDVDTCAQGEDASKVLVNIKKRKDRAKRKKQAKAGEEDEDEDEQLANKPRTGDAFEDVLYGSESEDEGSEEEEEQPAKVVKRKGGKDFGPRLRMDEDEPMDLLHGASSRIMTSDNQRRRKPGQDASRFKTDENTGKMIIDDGAASDNEEAAAAAAVDEAGAAYKETLTSVDGFTRGPNGRVKFHKDTKKRRREAEDDMDVDMGDSTASGKHKKANKKDEPRVGHEFKAKKAGGDVKKNGVDPYAYLSLSEAAGKKGGRGKRQKIGIVGKR